MTTPEQEFLVITKQTDKLGETSVQTIFDKLTPIKPDFLFGEWNGYSLDTGHVGHTILSQLDWAGKTFHSLDNCDPVVLYDKERKRVASKEWGSASLREVVFRGVTSTAMIYDERPIIDHFRFVDENTVAAAMDTPKLFGAESTYYFYITRCV